MLSLEPKIRLFKIYQKEPDKTGSFKFFFETLKHDVLVASLVVTNILVFEPKFDFMLGFNGVAGSVNNVSNGSFLLIGKCWRIYGVVASDSSHIGFIRKSVPGNFSDHVDSVDSGDSHGNNRS